MTLDDFCFEAFLGSGGQALLVSLKASPGERFAMKVVDKQGVVLGSERRVLEMLTECNESNHFVSLAYAF